MSTGRDPRPADAPLVIRAEIRLTGLPRGLTRTCLRALATLTPLLRTALERAADDRAPAARLQVESERVDVPRRDPRRRPRT
ncbi:hypothetical protein GCM10011581_25610 [Saccharopolyspora subtropica]|uniref:Uncharacterized protein n=1 Tax=Saccharopolyspora thermophila TaxID=89367 RepID=A0A917NBV7_9PSEU|nr:hypothetical protein [Saccharopolyspora subtropica]GGI87397.1 hypothetical protein GCM10011581_25610 [Saccharopolyspora subtropica]